MATSIVRRKAGSRETARSGPGELIEYGGLPLRLTNTSPLRGSVRPPVVRAVDLLPSAEFTYPVNAKGPEAVRCLPGRSSRRQPGISRNGDGGVVAGGAPIFSNACSACRTPAIRVEFCAGCAAFCRVCILKGDDEARSRFPLAVGQARVGADHDRRHGRLHLHRRSGAGSCPVSVASATFRTR